jgi:hypothetical protein
LGKLSRNCLPSGDRMICDPITPVVTYPDTIDLARVPAMPRWRHPTSPASPASKHEIRQFRRDINHHVAIHYHSQDSPCEPLFRCFQKRHDPRCP